METEPKEKGNDGYSLESLRRGSLCGINGSCGLSYYSVIRMLYKSEKRMILHVIQ
jgi:hypothetical protein